MDTYLNLNTCRNSLEVLEEGFCSRLSLVYVLFEKIEQPKYVKSGIRATDKKRFKKQEFFINRYFYF